MENRKLILDQRYLRYGGEEKQTEIPEGVEVIAEGAFMGCTTLHTIRLPDSLKEIGNGAFSGCVNLEKLVIPTSVSVLPPMMFFGCRNLKELILPPGLQTIEASAFADCLALREIVIPAGVTAIDADAFAGCTQLERIRVAPGNRFFSDVDGVLFSRNGKNLLKWPEGKKGPYLVPTGVVRIGRAAFADCRELKELVLPESVKAIGPAAFRGCRQLSRLTVEGKLEWIGERAFTDCSELLTRENGLCCLEDWLLEADWDLEAVNIPANIRNIGYGVFEQHTELRRLVFPAKMDQIMNAAFRDCTSLRTVVFPERIRRIGKEAFAGCIRLEQAKLPAGLRRICDGTFRETGLRTVILPEGVRKIEKNAFQSCRKLTEAELPESLQSIGSWAFQDCSALRQVRLPAKLRLLGSVGPELFEMFEIYDPEQDPYVMPGTVFWGCKNLAQILVDQENPIYREIHGILYSKDGTKLLLLPSGRVGEEIIPEGVTHITIFSVEDLQLTSLYLPDSMQEIEEYRECSSTLRSITLPDTCDFFTDTFPSDCRISRRLPKAKGKRNTISTKTEHPNDNRFTWKENQSWRKLL